MIHQSLCVCVCAIVRVIENDHGNFLHNSLIRTILSHHTAEYSIEFPIGAERGDKVGIVDPRGNGSSIILKERERL
jgi:hypothetical protein